MKKITAKHARAQAAKLAKAAKETQQARARLDDRIRDFETLPVQIETARAELQEAKENADELTAALSKPLTSYARKGYNDKRLKNPEAEAARIAQDRAKSAQLYLDILTKEAAGTLEDYTADARAWLDQADADESACRAILSNMLALLGVSDVTELPEETPTAEPPYILTTIETDKRAWSDWHAWRDHHSPDGLSIPAVTLYKAAQDAYKGRPSGNVKSLPVLNCFLLTVAADVVSLAMSNLTTYREAKIEWGNKAESFMTCPPAAPFLDWLRIAAEYHDILTLTLDARCQIMTIRADGTRAEFKCISADDFPPRPQQEPTAEPTATQQAPEEPEALPEPTPEQPTPEQAPAITPEPARYDLTEATIRAKYAWIAEWEADPKRRIYKSTLHNARVDMQREIDTLKALDVTAEFRALVNA